MPRDYPDIFDAPSAEAALAQAQEWLNDPDFPGPLVVEAAAPDRDAAIQALQILCAHKHAQWFIVYRGVNQYCDGWRAQTQWKRG